MAAVNHPYLPRSLKLPHFIQNTRSTAEILTILSISSGIIVIIAWILSGRRQEPFCWKRRLVLVWFMLCGFIHLVLEGYFAAYHAVLAGHSSVLGEMWKEYSLCDSRYIGSDAFVVCMETITAVIDGPLAFVTFAAFMTGNNYRYALQLILSLCQLYGDVLYFGTAYKEGFVHGPTDSPLYFCFYFCFLNAIWIVVPILLIIDSVKHIANCQRVSDFYVDEYNRKFALTNSNHHKIH
ncbi:unnamed protein product [Lymnaea stagnalis]|uniref:EXPERA domain-containing protein n=1 Tax=Lymnaea stagnalis TaxID=6523 RepID=A0AAV2HDW0_LYMST